MSYTELTPAFVTKRTTRGFTDNQGIRPSQHGFMKGRSCWTSLIPFYGQVTLLVDEGRAVDVVYLDFSRAFDTVSPQHPPGETSCPWFGWVYSLLDKELAEWLSTESGGEWS